MAESDVTYTAEQLAAMQSALNHAANEHDPTTVVQDLEAYYRAQTPVRGYAELALQVLENKGLGVVANQEVRGRRQGQIRAVLPGKPGSVACKTGLSSARRMGRAERSPSLRVARMSEGSA